MSFLYLHKYTFSKALKLFFFLVVLLFGLFFVSGGSVSAASTIDVSISKASDAPVVYDADEIQYTLTLENEGTGTVSSMTVYDVFDDRYSYQNNMTGTCGFGTVTTGTVSSGSQIAISNVDIPDDQSCTLSYTVVFNAPSGGGGLQTNTDLIVGGELTGNGLMQWRFVPFHAEYTSTPVVLATPVTDNNPGDSPIPVIRNVTTTGFEFAVCVDYGNPTCETSGVSSEDFHYFVVDVDLAANHNWIDAGFINNVNVNGSDTSFSFNATMSGVPAVWASAQTYNQGGNIGAHAWIEDNGLTSNGAILLGCTHQGIANNCDSGQPTENFGYVAIDPVSQAITGWEGGVENINSSRWTSISFSSKTNPLVMVTQNDDNGGQDSQYPWARSVTSTSAQIRYCEQDGQGDCDSHAGEKVRWFVIDGAVLDATYQSGGGGGFGSTGLQNTASIVYTGDQNSANDSDTLTILAGESACVGGTLYYQDLDGDGYSNGVFASVCDTPLTGWYTSGSLTATTGDCDDHDAEINPGTTEICDGIDNNCDGQIDDNVQTTYYADTDQDTFGDQNNTILACSSPVGYVSDSSDCDDSNPSVNLGSTEVCNGIDDDCDDQIDENASCESSAGICQDVGLTIDTSYCHALAGIFNSNRSNVWESASRLDNANVASWMGLSVRSASDVAVSSSLINNLPDSSVVKKFRNLESEDLLYLKNNKLIADTESNSTDVSIWY